MKLAKWIAVMDTPTKRRLAKMVDCHRLYLYQVAKDGCSARLAQKIVKAIERLTPEQVVHRWEIRPDIWQKGE